LPASPTPRPHLSFSRHSCESVALWRGWLAGLVETRWICRSDCALNRHDIRCRAETSPHFLLHQQQFLRRGFVAGGPPMADSSLSHGGTVRPVPEESVIFAPRGVHLAMGTAWEAGFPAFSGHSSRGSRFIFCSVRVQLQAAHVSTARPAFWLWLPIRLISDLVTPM
jgi:hypothetical protein